MPPGYHRPSVCVPRSTTTEASSEVALRYQHATRGQDVALAAALSEMVERSRRSGAAG